MADNKIDMSIGLGMEYDPAADAEHNYMAKKSLPITRQRTYRRRNPRKNQESDACGNTLQRGEAGIACPYGNIRDLRLSANNKRREKSDMV